VRRMRMIWGLTVAAALAGSLLMASPAGAVSAKKPLQGSFHEEFSFDIDCGTFLLHEDVVEDGAFTVFFDADGAPMNVIVHHHFHGVITNPAGETFDDRGDWTDFIDLAATPDDIEDDIVAQAGSIFRIRVPGEGIVVQDTGLIWHGAPHPARPPCDRVHRGSWVSGSTQRHLGWTRDFRTALGCRPVLCALCMLIA
jgi:hypothetical protein